MITLYVIQSKVTRKRYVGITNNIQRRLAEHRRGNTKGGQILGDFDVLLTEIYPNYIQARQREIFLKSGKGRGWLKIINSRACSPRASSTPP